MLAKNVFDMIFINGLFEPSTFYSQWFISMTNKNLPRCRGQTAANGGRSPGGRFAPGRMTP
jgi:hypothetical protein